ncbi:hypothetical protein NUW58_g2459 [Xylaria curta]|uniref:Uncharacterized protein n=1 Tax=Xylaria curta TaxID=42375 RepID=A0ACC1PGE4_9PEZI|nr:hypothetical protein NUW58_g2459 [Xylaria curta]
MEEPPERRDEFQDILDASVDKVLAVRRRIITDLGAIEDRICRLKSDIRRLLEISGRHFGRGYIFPHILAAAEERRQLLSFEDVTRITREDMLRVFVDALEFVWEAHGVSATCEESVKIWRHFPRRDKECFGDICTILKDFLELWWAGPEVHSHKGGKKSVVSWGDWLNGA